MKRTLAATGIAVAIAVAGCKPSSSGPQKTGPVVAQGDGVAITADEVKARIDEQSPFQRQRYQALDRKKEFVDNLVRFELLAKAAEKEGYANDPDVQLTMKKAMVQKLVQKKFAEGDPAQVPDADVQKYYESHRDEFVRPARIRVTATLFAATDANRAAQKAKAQKALAQVKAAEKKDPSALQKLAKESSDDVGTRNVGGDLGFRSKEELARQYGDAFANAASSAKDLDTLLVESPVGFWVLRVVGRQEGMERTVEQVKPQIAGRILREKRTREFDEYVKKLREDAKVTINDAELEKVQVAAPAAPAPAPGMPGMPGMPPGHGAPPPAPPAPAAK